MATKQQERGAGLDPDDLCCSVCLDLLRDPVTIPCGHSYCRSCIKGCWGQGRDGFSCPQCRETFRPRPALRRNNVLAEVVEKVRRTSPQQASPSPLADMACDFCCGSKQSKATMSCLTCLASYCPAHLEPHYSVPVLKTHQLVAATIPLKEKMCTEHNKLMEVYCQTDKTCICYLCTIDEHKGHSTVSAAAERATEQKQLIASQKTVQAREREREQELNELVQALKDFKSCTQTAVKSSDKTFDELISSIKQRRALAKELIKAQEKAAIAQAEVLQLKLGEEITKLKTRGTDLEQLSHTDDHIHFIQAFQSLSASCEAPDLPHGVVVRPRRTMEAVADCVSELRDNIEDLLRDAWPKISTTVSAVDVVLPPVPKTREDFLNYCCSLTLDVNSAFGHLSLSQENRRVTAVTHDLYYALHADRFTNAKQVLCKEGLSGRCYWEVSWSTGSHTFSVAVSYKDISRGSHDTHFGNNNKSWSLECSPNGYTFRHNNTSKAVSGPQYYRIGVYLDYKAGTLSFYSISATMLLLHKEHTTFTQPLHPGFGLRDMIYGYGGSYAEITKLW